MELQDLMVTLLTPAAQVAMVMAIAQLAKEVGIPARFIPILDLVLGLISGIFVYGIVQKVGIVNGIILGIFIGLSACGLFSGIKNVKGVKNK